MIKSLANGWATMSADMLLHFSSNSLNQFVQLVGKAPSVVASVVSKYGTPEKLPEPLLSSDSDDDGIGAEISYKQIRRSAGRLKKKTTHLVMIILRQWLTYYKRLRKPQISSQAQI